MTIQDRLPSLDNGVDSLELRPRLGELLVQSGKLTLRDLDRAVAAQQELGDLRGRVLVRLGLVSEVDILSALSGQLAVPLVPGDGFPELMPDVPGLLSEFLHANNVFPLRVDSDGLHVAMSVPQDAFVKKALQLATGLAVKPWLALESDIERALAGPARPHTPRPPCGPHRAPGAPARSAASAPPPLFAPGPTGSRAPARARPWAG